MRLLSVRINKLTILSLIGLFWIVNLVHANPTSQDDADLSGIVIASVAWSPDGSQIAIGKGRAICGGHYNDPHFAILILNPNGQLVSSIIHPACTATAIAWSPDSTTLVTTDNGAGIWFWDAVTGTFLGVDSLSFQGSPSLIWSPDSKIIYGIGDYSIYDYDFETRQVRPGNWTDHKTKLITSIALSPDGSKLASGDQDSIIRIMDTTTKETLLTFETQTPIPTALDWSSDGSTIASGFADGTVKIWDASTGNEIRVFVGHTDTISVIAWSPDSERLATASYDGTVREWDALTGEQLELFEFPGKVLALDWSPDGTQIVYGGVRSDFQDTDPIIVTLSQSERPQG